MNKAWSNIVILFILTLGVFSKTASTEEPVYKVTQVTDKIQVIYGPFDLPDSINRGF